MEGGLVAQPARRSRRGAGGQGLQPRRLEQLPAVRWAAAVRARGRGPRRSRHGGRGAGGADRAGAGDQGAGRGTGGERRGRGALAGPGASAMGLVPDDGPRRAVPRQADRGAAGQAVLAAEAPSPAEHWVVVRGTAEVTRDDELLLLRENESVYLPLGCVHRLANPGGSRWRSSRSRPAPIWRRTTSCGSRTTTVGSEASVR